MTCGAFGSAYTDPFATKYAKPIIASTPNISPARVDGLKFNLTLSSSIKTCSSSQANLGP
jgi:hypothetical protein